MQGFGKALFGLAIVVASSASACERSKPSYDSFPISIERAGQVPTWYVRTPMGLPSCPGSSDPDSGVGVGVADAGVGALAKMLIDPGSPLTLFEFCPEVARTRFDLEVVSALDPSITRARFLDLAVLSQAGVLVGFDDVSGSDRTRVSGLVGADLLSSFAVRFSLDPAQPGGATMQLFPATVGSESEHALACDSVLPFQLLGGGGVIIAGQEQALKASRIVLAACLEPDPFDPAPPLDGNGQVVTSGIDLALLLSTGTGPLLLGRSTVARLDAAPGRTPLALADGALHLPSGTIQVGLGTIGRLTLVRDEDRGLGPCEELAQARRLEATGTCPPGRTCTATAYVELERALPVARAADETAVLQQLRTELRPFTRELDGLLGAEALRDVVLDVDYPSLRMIMRCADGRSATCQGRPRFTGSTRDKHVSCLPRAQ